jgi:hypothetical protein
MEGKRWTAKTVERTIQGNQGSNIMKTSSGLPEQQRQVSPVR